MTNRSCKRKTLSMNSDPHESVSIQLVLVVTLPVSSCIVYDAASIELWTSLR